MIVFSLFLAVPGAIFAAEQEVCTTSYGQGVVCGKKSFEEPKEIVSAGLAEDLRLIGAGLIVFASVLYLKNRRANSFDEIGG